MKEACKEVMGAFLSGLGDFCPLLESGNLLENGESVTKVTCVIGSFSDSYLAASNSANLIVPRLLVSKP